MVRMTGSTPLHIESRPSMLSSHRIALQQHSGARPRPRTLRVVGGRCIDMYCTCNLCAGLRCLRDSCEGILSAASVAFGSAFFLLSAYLRNVTACISAMPVSNATRSAQGCST